jgi:hypothetical protein
VHAPPATITNTLPLPPLASNVADGGTNVQVQRDAWRTVTACPAIVNVPLRGGPELGAALNCALPGPTPDGVATVIQESLAVAVQGQPAPVATEVVAEPPEPGRS